MFNKFYLNGIVINDFVITFCVCSMINFVWVACCGNVVKQQCGDAAIIWW